MKQKYSQIIKEHYHHPLNAGKLSHYTRLTEQLNPLCGDETKIYLKLALSANSSGRMNLRIKDISHETRGCMISIAAASVLSEFVKGKTLAEIKKIAKRDVDKLLGVNVSPARQSCATLALLAMQKG